MTFDFKKEAALVAGILVLAAILRFTGLGGADLWGDETLFIKDSCVSASTPGELPSPGVVYSDMRAKFSSIGHLPVPFVLQNMYVNSASGDRALQDVLQDPVLQRTPAVWYGVWAVLFLYLLARVVAG